MQKKYFTAPPARPTAPQKRVAAEYGGQRLDNYLAREMKGAPRKLIYRLIRTGQVRINSRRAAPKCKLAEGDVVRIPDCISLAPPAAAAPPAALPVLFENNAFLAVNKPSGMAVHGGSGVLHGVIERLRAARQERFLELAHRLDKHTSGVLLLAKKSSALRAVQSEWRARRVHKIYYALCFGQWRAQHAKIDLPIKRVHGKIGGKIAADGRESLTRTVLVRQFPAAALVQADLSTGRTHQLRVHLSAAGLPIIGDDKYGDFAANRALPACRRLFLHAAELSFVSPPDGEKINIRAPLPEEFARMEKQLQ